MKTNHRSLVVTLSIFAGSLLLAGTAHAQITAIYNSDTTNLFLDSTSFNGGNAGSDYYLGTGTGLWNGSPFTISQVGSTTLDSVSSTASATYSGSTFSFSVSDDLSQTATDTGFATSLILVYVNYQLGNSGLSAASTYNPSFLVSGTVGSATGSYADFQGRIDYYSGGNLLDTVTYSWTDNTPGSFSTTVTGSAVNGTIPSLAANSTLLVDGVFSLKVDPSTLHVETVPEPGGLAFAGLGAALFAFGRRRKFNQSKP